MTINPASLTITSAHAHLMKGDFSARELTESYLGEIRKKNGDINAYLEVFDDCLEQAEEADKKIVELKKLSNSQTLKPSKLIGIPIAVKDNILIKDRRAGSASKILEGYRAVYDSTAIKKLKEAGSVFLGRTNMDEFAMGSSTENSAYGPTKNPHDLSRVPGGSSGGSAAAIAMGGALAALGSDTGGSIRQPASFCGVVGLKPTYGAVSRSGLMAMGSSLDCIGPLAKNTEDAEIIFNAIRGKDPLDFTSRDFSEGGKKEKIVVGDMTDFIDEIGTDSVSSSVKKNYKESLKALSGEKGVEVRNLEADDLSALKHSLAVYYIIMPAEVSSNLARFDGVKFGALEEGRDLLEDYLKTRGRLFGKEVRRRIILGTYVLSAGYYDAYYNKANEVRDVIRQTFDNIWKKVDVILMPTTPSPAFKIGEKTSDPLQMYLEDVFTVTANIAGVPAISIPSGFETVDGKRLPLGIQFMAPNGREDILFDIGKKFEKIRENKN